jgi:hypothetical protein
MPMIKMNILKQGVVAHAFNPSTREQRQADFWVRGQPGLQSEFQDSQCYTEKPCLEKTKKKKKKKKRIFWSDQAHTYTCSININ